MLKDCLKVDRDTENSLVIQFNRDEIDFLRKNSFTVYRKDGSECSKTRITLNDYVEYNPSKLSDRETLMRQNVLVNNHITIVRDCENVVSREEIEFLHEQAIKLSENFSTCL